MGFLWNGSAAEMWRAMVLSVALPRRITMDLDHALDKLQLPFRVEMEKSVVWKSGTRLC